MYFYPYKGSKSPSQPAVPLRQLDDRVSLSERKLSAWALVMGVRMPYEHAGHRMRRGSLPDVDFSGASPDPGYRSPLGRLADRIASLLWSIRDRQAPITTVAGAVAEDIGESARTPYIRVVEPAVTGKPDQTGDEESGHDEVAPHRRAA